MEMRLCYCLTTVIDYSSVGRASEREDERRAKCNTVQDRFCFPEDICWETGDRKPSDTIRARAKTLSSTEINLNVGQNLGFLKNKKDV